MNKVVVFCIALIFGLAVVVAIDAVLALAVEALWNGVLVQVIGGVKEVSYWQAFGILLLAGFLFKPIVNNNSSSK